MGPTVRLEGWNFPLDLWGGMSSSASGQLFNLSCLLYEDSLKTPKEGAQRASRLVNQKQLTHVTVPSPTFHKGGSSFVRDFALCFFSSGC